MMFKRLKTNRWIPQWLVFCFMLLIARDFFLAPVLFAQNSAEALLMQGVNAYENVDFEEAVKFLTQALETGLEKKEQRIQAYRYLAFTHAALGETEQSRQTFLELLALNPDFDLPVSASPKLRDPLSEARKTFAQRQPADTSPPVIVLHPSGPATVSKPLRIQAQVTDDSGVEQVLLFSRTSGQPRFVSETMQPEGGNQYTITLSGDRILLPALEYYIQATDSKGNGPAHKGSSDNPLQIAVEAVDKSVPDITHYPPAQVREGEGITLTATVKDETGIRNAAVRFREHQGSEFKTVPMVKTSVDQYQVNIPANVITPPAIYYYITAVDASGNQGFWKSEADAQRLTVQSKPVAETAPVRTEAVQPQKKGGSKAWLWVGLSAAAIGGVVVALSGSGGGGESGETRTQLPSPPSGP